MESDKNDFDILKLCPNNEDDLSKLSTSLIKILLTPRERIRKPDREKADIILAWGRKIIEFGGCLKVNQLSGIHCIETLYKNEEIDVIEEIRQNKDLDYCLVIGKFLMISCLENELKCRILLQIIKNISHLDSEEVKSFLCELWESQDEIPLTMQVREELTQYFPLCVEQFLMNAVEKVIFANNCDEIDIIVNSEYSSLCELCANSAKIFQVVLSILQEFLLLSDVHENLMYFISKFFHNVEKCCEKSVFLELLPFEVRIYITIMQFKPSSYPDTFVDSDFTKTNVLNLLAHFVRANNRVGGALLSYFPEWLPFILNHSKQCGISELIPQNKKDGEKNAMYLKFILQAA